MTGSSARAQPAAFKCIIAAALALVCSVAGAGGQRNSERARAFAKLPDWSGIWLQAVWPLEVSGRIAGGEAKLREGLQLIRRPPYNPQWSAKYEAALKDTAALSEKNATFKVCSRSFPALMESPWEFQLLVLPEETAMVFENGQVRHVHTDGRAHPSGGELWPTRLGDSVGRWQGDTLLIDTVARDSSEPVAPRAWVSMLSDQAHFSESLRLIDQDTLEDQLTIDDAIALAKPWRITMRYLRQKNLNRVLDYDCTENDRTAVVGGKIVITP